jgi:site-specific recombinase XerD
VNAVNLPKTPAGGGHTARERLSDSSVSVHYRAIQQWYAWLYAADEIRADPMARTKAPRVGEKLVPVLTDSQMKALLTSCSRRGAMIETCG